MHYLFRLTRINDKIYAQSQGLSSSRAELRTTSSSTKVYVCVFHYPFGLFADEVLIVSINMYEYRLGIKSFILITWSV